jgi:hypothetical protein
VNAIDDDSEESEMTICHTRARLATWLLIVAAVGSRAAPLTAQGAPSFSIGGIQAKLFFQQTGTFSEDLLAKTDIGLFNTPLGEGWAKSPSNSTLVVVQVNGRPNSYQRGAVVELLVAEGQGARAVVLKKSVRLLDSGPTRSLNVAFWLYNTGCMPLTLRARITGLSASPAEMTKRIPFQCSAG